MKEMKTVDAVGQILCHDITQIIRGVTKDAVFRKGHVIREEDIPVLATNALKDACGFTNPIQATHEEIMAIFRAAM